MQSDRQKLKIIRFANKLTPKNWKVSLRKSNYNYKHGIFYVRINLEESEHFEAYGCEDFLAYVELPIHIFEVPLFRGNVNNKSLKKLNRRKFTSLVDIHMREDSFNEYTLTHELAHVAAERRLVQIGHLWRYEIGLGAPKGSRKEDTWEHGIVFKWAYNLLINRLIKLGYHDLADECKTDLGIYGDDE